MLPFCLLLSWYVRNNLFVLWHRSETAADHLSRRGQCVEKGHSFATVIASWIPTQVGPC